MRDHRAAVRTLERDAEAEQDLLLTPPQVPAPSPLPEPRPADRIKEALLRWLEEEL